jgi:hypothetical protein
VRGGPGRPAGACGTDAHVVTDGSVTRKAGRTRILRICLEIAEIADVDAVGRRLSAVD